jgi:hypothetical protein
MTSSEPRHEGRWAKPVERLHVEGAAGEKAFNLEGKRVAGPQHGFGSLWDRTFTITLGDAITPEALVADWKSHFGDFWPKGTTFHGTGRIRAGDVTPLTAGGLRTGILVMYEDDSSFSYITPEGHMFGALITFSARHEASGGTMAEIRMLVRPYDPLVQAAFGLGARVEADHWKQTLRNIAAKHGVTGVEPTEVTVCVDRRFIWRNWTNVFHGVLVNNLVHRLTWRRGSAP